MLCYAMFKIWIRASIFMKSSGQQSNKTSQDGRVYIYIYLWFHFPGPGLENSIPPWESPAQKVTFWGVQFRERFPEASEGFRRAFWDTFWRVLGSLFLLSDQESVRYLKKLSFGVFLGGKSIALLLQKHANRTVHPSKIEGVLPMV